MENKNNKKAILGVLGIVVLVLVFAAAYFAFRPDTQQGAKNIKIEVVNSLNETVSYEVKTDAEFLGEAFKDAEGLNVEGEKGPYGLMILAVNGEKAVYEENGAYWSIIVNGEYGMYGADEQPVADGDEYQLVYTKDEE